ncbi:hypothetical protein [Nonomuraea sp. NEAU-A123]|uniref:hypothetical protein n=1 Tax=Nonomuraea sp. NEAU-A123 TaxID=2839649 RepID=UPI001BE47F72|nr:hypothetical protein [Nonomuraea sp. NEAU-A123]MBT2233271.1 hypothetical protein [Nonomuraea sp. NEAU-A123]
MEDDPFAEDEDFSDEDELPSVAEICVGKTTMLRTAYRPCDDAQKGYAWYYLTLDEKIPPVGKKPKSGSFESPGDDRVRVSDKGGSGDAIALSDDADRVEVCVRTSTRVRTGDVHCDDEDGGYAWYYIPISHRIPRVGARAERGTYHSSDYWTTYRARSKGGEGRAAATEEPDPEVSKPTTRPTQTCRTPDMRRPAVRYCSWSG